MDPRLERATIAEPSGIEGAAARVRERNARAFADSVQSQCFSSVSSAGRMTPVAARGRRRRSGRAPRPPPRRAWTRRCRARGPLDAELAELGPRSPPQRCRPACSRARSRAPSDANRSAITCRSPRPAGERTEAPSKPSLARRRAASGAGRRRAPRRNVLPADPAPRLGARPRPATRRGRAGRGAPSAPRRDGGPGGRREALRRARGYARAAGTRSAGVAGPTSASMSSIVGSATARNLAERRAEELP